MTGLLWTLLAAVALALGGCASMYFKDAGPAPEVRHDLASLPYFDYWTGIVFNGEKVGFSYFSIRKEPGAPRHEVRSEASIVLRFLGLEKTILLRSRDVINADLTLVAFDYWFRVDDSELQVAGRREGDALVSRTTTGGVSTAQRLPAAGRLYPTSVINLYPVLHGLEVGREHKYVVYHGQTQSLAEVTQRIAGYEKSDLYAGNAFKVETAMRGQRVTSWIGPDGRLRFELAMYGALISFLEDAESAARYLALSGAPALPPSDAWQRCARHCRERELGRGAHGAHPALAGREHREGGGRRFFGARCPQAPQGRVPGPRLPSPPSGRR